MSHITRKWMTVVAAASVCAVGIGVFAGCGSSAGANGPQTISVGFSTQNNPYEYVDKDNNPTGFEVALFQAVDKELPDYEFKFTPYDFNGVIAQLNARKSDLVIATLDTTKERMDKFGATASYAKDVTRLVVNKDNTSITTVKDLAGKTFYGGASTYPPTAAVEQYNKNHGNKIDIQYGGLTSEQIAASLEHGTYDAFSLNPVIAQSWNKQYGDHFKTVGEDLTEANIVAYASDKQFAALPKIDKALHKLYEDGTVAALSKQYLGDDYSQYVAADEVSAN